jgi:tricorn protease
MKIFSILLNILSFVSLIAQTNIFFTSDPAPSPDASRIVFAYDNDLWKVSADGGLAMRITGMDGRETDPVFSPDGKWIAFTGRQDGNPNIYVIPAEGGEITQLTFNDANDYVESWSWDSKFIYFNSTRYNNITSYKISVIGGTPKRIFSGFKNRQHNVVEHPGDGAIYFNESWESNRFATRKRYKGDYNPDIKSYNFNSKEYKEHTSYRGKDMYPTIDKNGNIYFVSDRGNDEFNLYKLINGSSQELTRFETSIKRPRVSTNGKLIVFEKDYQIYSYNVVSGQSSIVPIELYQNFVTDLDNDFNVKDKITNFNVSPDGKKMAFVSRGRLFVSDIKGKFVKELGTDSNERVVEVLWLKDSKTILYNRTEKGWLNLFTIGADGKGSEKQLTFDEQNNQEINLNNDRTKAVYFSGRNEMRVLDAESMKSETVVEDEFWALYPSPAYFSPDDKFIAYTAYRNFEHDIFVYDVENEKVSHITKTGMTETEPFWSPDGKYLYFSSDPFNAGYPRGTRDTEIYRVGLKKYDKDFKVDQFNKLFIEEEKDTSKPVVEIDFDNLQDRWEGIATQPTNQGSPFVIQKDDQTHVLFVSNHDSEGNALWKTTLKPFDKKETKKISGTSGYSYQICEANGKHYILTGGSIHELKMTENKTNKISIDFKFSKNLAEEFPQMFYETWANLEENFYDENFHGIDWNLMKERYGKFLPQIKTRANLRTLTNDMLGELNSSHLGFTSSGKEEDTFYKNSTISIGVVFDNEDPYKVERIVSRSAMDKVEKGVKQGDRLVAVNGNRVDEKINREFYLTGSFKMDEVVLTFERDEEEFDVNVHPETVGNMQTQLYDEWVDGRQKIVDDQSNKRIAYIHMKNMGGSELNRFLKEIANEAHYRDALILDLRYNRGGNVHDKVLQTLSQRTYMNWKYRGGKLTPQPNFAPSDKPIIMLINEQSLSDAELTAAGFKALGLGTVLGTETYRWLIFTSGKSLVDGSFYRLPSWGCYRLDGKDIEMHGVEPDIYLKNTMVDRLNGDDPQLLRAVELIMNELN